MEGRVGGDLLAKLRIGEHRLDGFVDGSLAALGQLEACSGVILHQQLVGLKASAGGGDLLRRCRTPQVGGLLPQGFLAQGLASEHRLGEGQAFLDGFVDGIKSLGVGVEMALALIFVDAGVGEPGVKQQAAQELLLLLAIAPFVPHAGDAGAHHKVVLPVFLHAVVYPQGKLGAVFFTADECQSQVFGDLVKVAAVAVKNASGEGLVLALRQPQAGQRGTGETHAEAQARMKSQISCPGPHRFLRREDRLAGAVSRFIDGDQDHLVLFRPVLQLVKSRVPPWRRQVQRRELLLRLLGIGLGQVEVEGLSSYRARLFLVFAWRRRLVGTKGLGEVQKQQEKNQSHERSPV